MNEIDGTFPIEACDVAGDGCNAKADNPSLVAPCGTEQCCDWESSERPACPESASKTSGGGSLVIIIPVVVAAVLLVAAVLYLVRERVVAARQPHRQPSMPTVGGAEAEVET